MVEQG